MSSSMESLIKMDAGGLELPPGQKSVLPEDNQPTTGPGLLGTANAATPTAAPQMTANHAMLQNLAQGKPAVPAMVPAGMSPIDALFHPQLTTTPAAAPVAPSQPQSPATTNQLPPMIPGTPMSVVQTGNGQPAGANFYTNGPAPTAMPTQQAAPVIPVTPSQPPAMPAPSVQTFQHVDHDDDDGLGEDYEMMDEDFPEVTAALQTAPVVNTPPAPSPVAATSVTPPTPTPTAPVTPVPSTPTQAPSSDPVMMAVTAIGTPTSQPPAGTVTSFRNDQDLNRIQQTIAMIESRVRKEYYDLGLALLENPNKRDSNLYIHEVIHWVRWRTLDVINLGPHEVLKLGQALSAHQLYVQSQENYWSARHQLLSKELERIIFIKRENYADQAKGKTKTEMENILIETEPQIRDLRNEYLLAQAMANALENMGERFVQLEDGLKRTITFVVREYERTTGNKFTV